MFDVPVLVQECPEGEKQHYPMESSSAQYQDRTISDFSLGSAAEEMEYVWRRDVQPDSLIPISQRQANLVANESSDSHSRVNTYFRQKSAPCHGYKIVGTSSFDGDRRHNPGKGHIGHAVPVWLDQEGKPLYGFSKSTTDLRPESKGRYSSSVKRHKMSARKRIRTTYEAGVSQSPHTPKLVRSSSQRMEKMKKMPAYIPSQMGAEGQTGYIPLWYPKLACVGECNKQLRNNMVASDVSSQSSFASENGSCDFPSDYSSSGQHHIHSTYAPAALPSVMPNTRTRMNPASEYQYLQMQSRSPKSMCSTPDRNASICHGNCSLSSHEHSGHSKKKLSRTSSRQSNKRLEHPNSRPNSRGKIPVHQCSERHGYTSEKHRDSWTDENSRECRRKLMDGCTCDHFLYMEVDQPKDMNNAPTLWSQSHKISSPDLSDIEAMTSS